jgi:hypothetical protein
LKNIFEEGELDEYVVCAKFALTTKHGAIEGKTQEKEVIYYILLDKGKVSALEAKIKAETEYDKFRVIQDQQYISDFDEEVRKLIGNEKEGKNDK